MANRHLQIEAGQCSSKGCAGVTMDQNHIGLLLFQYRLDACEDAAGDIKQGLPLLHDGQIVIRLHMKGFQHLVEHLTVLAGDANQRPQVFPGLEFVNQGAHFNSFGTGSEYEHDCFHVSNYLFFVTLRMLLANLLGFIRIFIRLSVEYSSLESWSFPFMNSLIIGRIQCCPATVVLSLRSP